MYKIAAVIIFLLASAHAFGQHKRLTGNAGDTTGTNGSYIVTQILRIPFYATNDPTIVLGVDGAGNIVPRTMSSGSAGLSDSMAVVRDSLAAHWAAIQAISAPITDTFTVFGTGSDTYTQTIPSGYHFATLSIVSGGMNPTTMTYTIQNISISGTTLSFEIGETNSGNTNGLSSNLLLLMTLHKYP